MLLSITGVILVVIILAVLEEKADTAACRAPEITLIPSDCFNLKIIRRGKSQVDVTPARVNHGWFAGTFDHLPIDTEVTLRICMAGNDIGGNIADCAKWVGLRPVMTYADPAQYESYQWYRRDAQGRWVSGDPCRRGTAKFAGTGPTPKQEAIPADLAAEFLSADGETWSPWRELKEGKADTCKKIFTIRERFARPTATIALHFPYTVAYQEAFLQRLRAGKFPGVTVDELGESAEGRKLYMVRLDDPEAPTPLRMGETLTRGDGTIVPVVRIEDPPGAPKPRVLLVNAREHGSEHAGSWVVQGVLRHLLADTPDSRRLRRNTTWLLQLIYDPDGAVNSIFHAITDSFFPHDNHPRYGSVTPPEVIAYARYLRAFVNSGRILASVASFYGFECNEGKPVVCPNVIKQEKELTLNFNEFWFSRLNKLGIPTNPPRRPWFEMWVPYRLHVWCWYWYSAMSLAFMVSDRSPKHRLDLPGLERVGACYAAAMVDYLETPRGQLRLQETQQFLERRKKERELWFRTSMAGTPDDPTLYDMLSMGY
jgi:hypothetical protein